MVSSILNPLEILKSDFQQLTFDPISRQVTLSATSSVRVRPTSKVKSRVVTRRRQTPIIQFESNQQEPSDTRLGPLLHAFLGALPVLPLRLVLVDPTERYLKIVGPPPKVYKMKTKAYLPLPPFDSTLVEMRIDRAESDGR